MKRMSLIVGVVLLLLCGAVDAQTNHPGFFPIEEMGIMAQGELEVDIDLHGAMLQVAAGAMQGENGEVDADLGKLVASLERVRVQVGSPQKADQTMIGNSISDAVDQLTNLGWQRILKVNDDETMVYLFALESGGKIVGLTGLVNSDGDELVLANLVGDIDPVLLGRLLSKMDDLPGIEDLMESVHE